MVLAFVTAWLQTIATVGKGFAPKSEACFMDGPYRVELSLLDRTTAIIKGFRDTTHGPTLQLTSRLPLHELLVSAINTGRALEAVCEEKGWQRDRDTRAMKRALSECQQLLRANVGNA